MKRRKNGEGTIKQRADGRWEVIVSINSNFETGENKRVSRYAKTQDDAVKLLHQLTYTYETYPKTFSQMTLGTWLDLCLEVYMKHALKQSTYLSYEAYIRLHFKPALGDIPLQDLSPRTLQLFYNHKAEHDGLAPKTIVNLNLFLHKALNFAVNEGYIRTNPAEALNLSRGMKPQIEILTRDEQNRLMQGSYQHRYGVFIRLVLFTGLRLGELLGLRWEDIDYSARVIHIRRTLNRLGRINRIADKSQTSTEIVIQSPKSQNAFRTVPLLPQVLGDLQTWAEVQRQDKFNAGERYTESGFIVTNPNGGYIEPRTFKDYYDQILELSGLGHFTFHALRHTFASRAMEQGMDAKTLSVILGHYSVSFTLDTYTHILDEHKHKEIALMNDLFIDQETAQTPELYPVVITMQEDSTMSFEVPGMPQVTCESSDIQTGLQIVKDALNEELLTSVIPLNPVPIQQIPLAQNQMLMQIAP